MTMRGASLLCLVMVGLGLGACAARDGSSNFCSSDAECPASEVCFQDGCGNPTDKIIVEVTPQDQSSTGITQDYAISNASGTFDLEVDGQPTVMGNAQLTANGVLTGFLSELTFSGIGSSSYLPSEARRFRQKVTPAQGAFTFPVSAGDYSLVVTAGDTRIPPFVQTVTVGAGGHAEVAPVLYSSADVIHLTGTVTGNGAPVPSGLGVQAFSTDDGGIPLSQRVSLMGDAGAFDLTLAPSAIQLSSVQVTVSPDTDQTVLLPQMTFNVAPGSSPTLDLGAYGAPFLASGTVVDLQGAPVGGASVHLEGTVEGGGVFRSATVVTDEGGTYQLQTLAPGASGALSLWVVPAASDSAGLVTHVVSVSAQHPMIAPVTCPNRVTLDMSVVLPNATDPAAGVGVQAVPISAEDLLPLPSQTLSTRTDGSGRFSVRLDPANYRIELQPINGLPRTSFFQQVVSTNSPNVSGGDGGTTASSVSIVLSAGRQLSGTITLKPDAKGTSSPAAQASLRFFARQRFGDTDSEFPLAETLTDDSGHYQVTVPAQ